MRILFVDGIYPEFQKELYAAQPGLATRPYVEQVATLLGSGFGHGDVYSHEFRKLGWESLDVVGDADVALQCWALENNLRLPENMHDRRRTVIAEQIERFRPDVLYVFEWSPLGDAFLADMKRCVPLVVGQVASPLPAYRTYAAYDLMISSFPPLVDYFRQRGIRAEYVRLAFDPRVLEKITRTAPRYDVTFVGGFAPSHGARIAWLEDVLCETPVDIFGYGVDTMPPKSPIRARHRGPAWGWNMYDVIAASKVTLNLHSTIEAGGRYVGPAANNMRLFEATGAGTCLITDAKPNLGDLFKPGEEVLTFSDARECAAQIRAILNDDARRAAISAAGQRRTLRDHTYAQRAAQLSSILSKNLRARSVCV